MADEFRATVVLVDEAVQSARAPDFAGAAGWGWVGLVASERGLRLLTLPSATRTAALHILRADYPDATLVEFEPAAAGPGDTQESDSGPEAMLQAAARQVAVFLAGDLREFTVPLDLRGYSSFALSVWAATLRIPYAQTRTYAWIARQVGGSGQGIYQAVGAALGSNPIPLIIPCHRVIGSDGSLHGYAGGLAMKARLLALETGQARLLA